LRRYHSELFGRCYTTHHRRFSSSEHGGKIRRHEIV